MLANADFSFKIAFLLFLLKITVYSKKIEIYSTPFRSAGTDWKDHPPPHPPPPGGGQTVPIYALNIPLISCTFT